MVRALLHARSSRSAVRDCVVVRGQVRTAGTHSGVRTRLVRAYGSQSSMREPGRPACYQKLWFPAPVSTLVSTVLQACQWQPHRHAHREQPHQNYESHTKRQPIQSQVFSGSTVSKATHCVGINTVDRLHTFTDTPEKPHLIDWEPL